MKVEISPRAEDDIIRQFRYYLLNQDAPLTAIRFRDAVTVSIKQLKQRPGINPGVAGSLPSLRALPVKGLDAIRIFPERSPQPIILLLLESSRRLRV